MVLGHEFLLLLTFTARAARRRVRRSFSERGTLAILAALVVVVRPFLASGETHNHEMTPSQPVTDPALSLEQVTKTALTNNPSIKAARST